MYLSFLPKTITRMIILTVKTHDTVGARRQIRPRSRATIYASRSLVKYKRLQRSFVLAKEYIECDGIQYNIYIYITR